mgnify:CR=1 FL=1
MIKYYAISTLIAELLMFVLNGCFKERIDRFHDATPLPESAPKIVAVFKLCIVCFVPILRVIYVIGDLLLITAPQAWVDEWNEKIDRGRR